MPNSSAGKQEVEQQEEELEVKEEHEQEQGEEQVVNRRNTVSKIPMDREPSKMIRSAESHFGPSMKVKGNTKMVRSDKIMLREVAFAEKVNSTSLCESRLQHFVLDSNEKKVKAGKSSREG